MKWYVAHKELAIARAALAQAQKAVAQTELGGALFDFGLWRFRRQIQ